MYEDRKKRTLNTDYNFTLLYDPKIASYQRQYQNCGIVFKNNHSILISVHTSPHEFNIHNTTCTYMYILVISK